MMGPFWWAKDPSMLIAAVSALASFSIVMYLVN